MGSSYLPLLVNKLLRTFTSQTVYQLRVVASVAIDQFGQHGGAFSGLGRRDGGPGTVGCPALEDCPGK